MLEPAEEHGGMSLLHHRHCPHAKFREDKKPKYHEEEQKEVAIILAAHPLITAEREQKYIDERNVACEHKC
jgi:hypothetical protein